MVNRTGYLSDLDIRVYTNIDVMCSVVSFVEIEDKSCTYQEKDLLSIWMTKTYVFKDVESDL